MDVGRWTHARIITDFKNMADYHEERTLKTSEKAKTKTRTTATRLQETSAEKRERQRSEEKRLWIETQNKFVDVLFA